MRCGRISVKGEAEEIISVSIKPRQRHGRRSNSKNPYSSMGLDKFASLNAELSAKREYVAKKTGTPEELLRFAYSASKGWIPLVVKNGAGVSIPPPVKTQQKKDDNRKKKKKKEEEGRKKKKNYKEEEKGDSEINEVEAGENNDAEGRSGSLLLSPEVERMNDPVEAAVPWTGYLMTTTAFGVLTVSAILVRKSAIPAAAMAVVMVVCTLQRRWQGGVMCMKRFIETGISYFSDLFVHWKKIPEIETPQQLPDHEIVHREGALPCLSAPTSPVRSRPRQSTVSSKSQELKDSKNNKIKYGRIVSMDSQPGRSTGLLQQSTRSQELKDSKNDKIKHGRIVSMDSQPGTSTGLLQQSTRSQELKDSKNDKIKYGRIVSMDSQTRRPMRLLQQSESFQRRRRAGVGTVDSSMGAIVMIVMLFFLVFYGKLCAIFFTSAWWYVLPKLKTDVSDNRSMMDVHSREYKKKVIMDGLLDRSHGKPAMRH